MTNNNAAQNNATQSSISIVDGKLILSLPNATSPVVWQMDLGAAQSSSFTINEDKKKKQFALISKNQDGNAEDIATFSDKDTAISVLMETASALQNAHGQIKSEPIATITPANMAAQGILAGAPANDTKNDKLGALLAVGLIIVLFAIWAISATKSSSLEELSSAPSSTPAQNSDATGVPVSADDFLNNR
ncbi:MAG: hypothetical protein ACRBDL_10185 [Alphaproteobacteria bacterium]